MINRLKTELPLKIKHTRAQMFGELIAEGQTATEARKICADTHRRTYRLWLREFVAEHPNLETVAKHILKQQGVL